MLLGLGGLGKAVLNVLALDPAIGSIVVASRNAAHGEAYCNLVRVGAAAAGRYPLVDFESLDLNHESEVAENVAREKPDIILTTATMMPWWLPESLPPEQAGLFRRAGFGAWLPVHLNLAIRLMRALALVPYTGIVLTAPFPDVVNPVLAGIGMAPACGVGNLAEIVPKVRLLAAARLGVAPGKVQVTLVAHHALEAFVFLPDPKRGLASSVPPFYLQIIYQGRDVTAELDGESLLFSGFPVSGGPDTHALTAMAALTTIKAFLSSQGSRIHVPGPLGLPGGYPVVASRSGVGLALPEGLTKDQAVAINAGSHRFDGIRRILADGAVEFVPETAAIMKETLGYDCPVLEPALVEPRAVELLDRFTAYAAGFGLAV